MSDASDAILWTPPAERVAQARLSSFAARAREASRRPLADYAALWRWSVDDLASFWELSWSALSVLGERGSGPAVVGASAMPGARFFPGARLSFAENLLRRDDDAPALISLVERGPRRELSYRALRRQVASLASALRELGVRPGDRVAAIVPNGLEAVVSMLATAAIGAVWSSCSPDFGVRGALDRIAQISPRVLVAAESYTYAGRTHALAERVAEIRAGLPSALAVIAIASADPDAAVPRIADALAFEALVERAGVALDLPRFPFDHPLQILYSSGTTGAPKCIVHTAGGTLLKHLVEHQLHCDVRRDDRFFYFTTCGWMMWSWLVSGLASGATLVLYDGSPLWPHPAVLFDHAERERIAIFGTSAKYLDAIATAGVEPRRTHALPALRTLLSTGSPLAPAAFDYVYARIARDVWLASISGGTDIVGCFVAGVPWLPVRRGEIQGSVLGMDVDVFDDAGRSLSHGTGELVCKRPFPSMPAGFFGDEDGSRYRAAYFERFPGVWHHGDWAERAPSGGLVILGRSDAVLNPGGVRIGTAEIYRPVEALDFVVEALAIGQAWQGDVRVVLFVVLREGVPLDPERAARIRDQVRREASPRHVPAVIVPVTDIPRTRSGKIVELAVREVVHGRPVRNLEALANPEALEQFRNRSELA
jgi:acetoacetyl-CoA synthetase